MEVDTIQFDESDPLKWVTDHQHSNDEVSISNFIESFNTKYSCFARINENDFKTMLLKSILIP